MEIMYERIKELRKNNKMSQQDLADKVGYTGKSMISKIERGEVDLSHAMILKFANALGVSAGYLAGYKDSPDTIDIDSTQFSDREELMELIRIAEQSSPNEIKRAIEILKILKKENEI